MKFAPGDAFIRALLDGKIGPETTLNVVQRRTKVGSLYGISLTNDEGIAYFDISPYEISVDVRNALIAYDKAVIELKADNETGDFTYSLRVDVRG
jgi:hypothetical protein